MLSGMPALDLMRVTCWGLPMARTQAQQLLLRSDQRRAAHELIAALMTDNPEQRKRAADVARRITEKNADLLVAHAAEFASVLADVPIAESRTRWHLGLVVARTARSPQQIRTAAALLWQLSEDRSNVVRCSAVEGLGLLALRDPSLRSNAETYLHQAFLSGTPAMRVRARDALRRLSAVSRNPVMKRSR